MRWTWLQPTIPMRGQETFRAELVRVISEANHPHEGSGDLSQFAVGVVLGRQPSP